MSSEDSDFLISLFASFLADLIDILAFSASDLAIFTRSFLLSSVRAGIFMIIDSPLFIGLKPMFAIIMAFSISANIDLSHGWITKVLLSGVLIFAICEITVGVP